MDIGEKSPLIKLMVSSLVNLSTVIRSYCNERPDRSKFSS